MKLAARVYEAFKDDEEKARVLAEVVEELERHILGVATKSDLQALATKDDLKPLATKDELEITKLTLQKEIEQVRGEVEQVRLSLQKEIEEVRLSLQKEIEHTKASLVKWVAGLLVVQTGVIVSIITLLG